MNFKPQAILRYSDAIPFFKTIKRLARSVSHTIWKHTPRDIKCTSAKLRNPIKRGVKKGRAQGASVFGFVVKEYKNIKFSREEIPALAASAVALTPVPSPVPIFPFVYGIGKLIYHSPRIVRSVHRTSKNLFSLIK